MKLNLSVKKQPTQFKTLLKISKTISIKTLIKTNKKSYKIKTTKI